MIVSLEDAKARLYVDHSDDDTMITSMIQEAQSMAEDFCGKSFETEIPNSVKLAVHLMVGYLYEHRDQDDRPAWRTTVEAFQRILWPNRDASAIV